MEKLTTRREKDPTIRPPGCESTSGRGGQSRESRQGAEDGGLEAGVSLR